MYDLIIIGGGAAGFFAAAQLAELKPQARILILEKTGKVLSKVKISGGGRCNVTHYCLDNEHLLRNYPRGNPWLRGVFMKFSVPETIAWFEGKGVKLVKEPDGRMFPATNLSQTIVDVLVKETVEKGVELQLNTCVEEISESKNGYTLLLKNKTALHGKTVLVASGGANSSFLSQLSKTLEIKVVSPAPSLFTFNVPNHAWGELQGISVQKAQVSVHDTPWSFQGAVLVTHWGFSGPAVLKCSAFAARYLQENQYLFSFAIDWLPTISTNEVVEKMKHFQQENSKKRPESHSPFDIPNRLWLKICDLSELGTHYNWAEVGKKKILVAASFLKSSSFKASGKTTYKDEFVTAGGLDLSEVDASTCELKRFRGFFLAGEVLDVDGVTGGFNFQAAWSTAAVAAQAIARALS